MVSFATINTHLLVGDKHGACSTGEAERGGESSTCRDPRKQASSEPWGQTLPCPSAILASIPLLPVSVQLQLSEREREEQERSFLMLTGVAHGASAYTETFGCSKEECLQCSVSGGGKLPLSSLSAHSWPLRPSLAATTEQPA